MFNENISHYVEWNEIKLSNFLSNKFIGRIPALCELLFLSRFIRKLNPEVIIDVGTNVVEGKLVGDVDYEGCFEKTEGITPVPGGVGPVTIMMLLENTMEAFVNKWD